MSRLIKCGSRYHGEYASIDPAARRGLRRIALGKNKTAADWALKKLEEALGQVRAGLTVQNEDLPLLIRDRFYAECKAAGLRMGLAEHAGRPLAEHLEAWRDHLLAAGGTHAHADLSRYRAKRICDEAEFVHWVDIGDEAVERVLAGWRNKKNGLSIATSNHYLTAFKGFCRWCVRVKRAAADPVAHMESLNADTDPRHARRALSAEELRLLIAEASAGPQRYGIGGADRAMLYRAAAETGLRANELRSLLVRDFELAGDHPFVKVRAAYAKGKREDDQPLRPEFARELVKHFDGRDKGEPVFAMPHKCSVARMFKDDLDAARERWLKTAGEKPDPDFLAYENGANEFADFHGLRHTYVTALARAGVHPKDAQELARHSTITLTMGYYTHTRRQDLQAAVGSLPDLSTVQPLPERETGRETNQAAG